MLLSDPGCPAPRFRSKSCCGVRLCIPLGFKRTVPQPCRIKLPRLKGTPVAFITDDSEPQFPPLEMELPLPLTPADPSLLERSEEIRAKSGAVCPSPRHWETKAGDHGEAKASLDYVAGFYLQKNTKNKKC